VRTYTGEPLDAATGQSIRDYLTSLTPPFGAKCRIEMINTAASTEPVKLGTYGMIGGATDFFILVIEGDEPLAEVGAAYLFERVVLYCTSLGLGTCWLGGSFNRGDFAKQLALLPGERVRIVSPVGHAANKRHLSLLSMMVGFKPKPRKPFSENFFAGTFGEPLTETAAGVYSEPLEMVRLAPSANNKQSWRVVMDGNVLHFYKSSSFGFDDIDLGIALCHFEQTCIEKGVAGRYETITGVPEGNKATYVISWVAE
jgi:hypothetical protein